MGSNEQTTRCADYIAAAVCLGLLLAGCFAACRRANTEGALVSASLSLRSYVQSNLHGGPGNGAGVFFPQLEIYNRLGELVYSSHESLANARILQSLPGSIDGLRPKPEGGHLAEVLEETPEFRERKQDVLGRRHISVLSVFLEDCHACAVQEGALSDAQNRLLSGGVNLLVIRVSRPAS